MCVIYIVASHMTLIEKYFKKNHQLLNIYILNCALCILKSNISILFKYQILESSSLYIFWKVDVNIECVQGLQTSICLY